MWRRFRKAAALLLAGLCMTGLAELLTVRGAEVEEAEGQTIRIGYIGYDGFINEEEDGTYSGYGAEFLDEIAKYTGWNYEYVFDNWENHLQGLKEGEIDFVCHAQKTPAREQEYLFPKYSIGAESSVLYVRMDDDRYYYNDFEYFDGMKIAFLKNSFQNKEFEEYAHKKGFSFQYSEYITEKECFAALDEGTVDAVAMGSLALKTDYKIVCRFGSDPFYFMTGHQNRELIDELNDALGQITADGSTYMTELYKKYYGSTVSQELFFTREEAEYIETADPITFACIPNRKPFSYEDENGEIKGITIDILNRMAERSGLTFEYEMMPAGKRTTEYLEEYPDVLIPGVLMANPAFKSKDYVVSKVFYSDDVALACLNGISYNVDAAEETYTLAIPRSYMGLEAYIRENYPQFNIVYEKSLEECLKLVNKGAAEFTAQNVNAIRPFLQDPHYEKIQIIPTFFMHEDTGIAGMNTKENRLLMGILDKCITTISDKEISQFTVDHTVGNRYQLTGRDMLYKFRYPFIVVVILLAAVIGLMMAFTILRKHSYKRLEEKNVQLAEAVAQADNANRAKSMFLARMSHEIRTPMNAIVGLTALAKHQKEEPEQVEEYLGKIEISSKVLLNIINDVLDMSAIESNKLKIAEKPFDLRETLDSLSAVYYTQCRQKGVSFEMNTREILHERVIGDGLRLNQILLNLISNAYKFTPTGGAITITVKEAAPREGKTYYKFIVKDNGEGMTPDMLSRLFRPFEQEGADTAQKHGGSGLGLSITKNLVDLMGGSIVCESEKGKGTAFTVTLPFGLDQSGEAAKKKEAAESQNGQTAGKEAFDFEGKTVLLAEDTAMNAEIVTALLELVNMKVAHAWNGKEAVEMFTSAEPGTYTAILMDVQMPVMNGYEATKAIRASGHAEAGTISIIAMTANAFSEDISEAWNVGMSGHIAKPIDTKLLYRTLQQAVERNKIL